MSEKLEKSGDDQIIIKLPDNPERVKKLEQKLEEYRVRLAKEKTPGSGATPNHINDTTYKIAILANVLEFGEIGVEDIAKQLSEMYGGINRGDFMNAATVVYNYVTAGGSSTTKPNMGLKE